MRGIGGWTLRARLVGAVIALLAVVCVVIGAVTVAGLRTYLIDQLDERLAAAGRGPGGGPGGPGGEGPLRLGQGPGTLGAIIRAGAVQQAARFSDDGNEQALPGDQEAVLLALPADGQPHTRDLGDFGRYRLQALRTQSGTTLVTGLPLADVDGTTYRLVLVVSLVSLAGLLAAGTATVAIVGHQLRPLQRVAATAGRVAELPLARGEVALAERVPEADTDQRTEVGRVGAALNLMLGHVADALAVRQASETRVRRFVADASHELRTPLAAIRGYAELTRRIGEPVQPEVRYAMDRVESEAKRLTVLVEELLLLARLDEGREPVHEPVDLSALLVDAVSDAHAAGPGHHWQLALPDEPVVVTGDHDQLLQVVVNLPANARAHTPPGTDVEARLSSDGDAAVVQVIDGGPGIPPELQEEVFERFARGDASRSRATGSTGLGLAIVAAVVAAHAGRVELDSRPGRTVFTVRLPVSQEPHREHTQGA
jgi:two-component system OmpR family sensor kinase